MSAPTLHSLTDDMSYYHKAFGVYHRIADRTNVIKEWVNTKLGEILNTVGVAGPGGADQDRITRVLSIGPGDGEIEQTILEILRDRDGPSRSCAAVHATVVEPAVDMVRKFKERVAAGDGERRITYDWNTQTLDEYQEVCKTTEEEEEYDFISSVHSIYYVDSIPGSIRYLYERLRPGGIMLIVVIAAESGFGQFGTHFPIHCGSDRHHPTSAQVEAACLEENIPIAAKFIIKVRSDITDCFADPKSISDDGRMLVDFFTHVRGFLGDAPRELRTDVLDFLRSERCSEMGDSERVYFNGDWKAIVIRR